MPSSIVEIGPEHSYQLSSGGLGAKGSFNDLLSEVRAHHASNKHEGWGAALRDIADVMARPQQEMSLTPALMPYMSVDEAHAWSRHVKNSMAAAEVTWHTTMACASTLKSGLQQLLKNQ